MKLYSMSYYPCRWDDFIDEKRRTYLTVYTLAEAKYDGFLVPGITRGKDGIYDIVVDASELTESHVREALRALSKVTKIDYEIVFNARDTSKP